MVSRKKCLKMLAKEMRWKKRFAKKLLVKNSLCTFLTFQETCHYIRMICLTKAIFFLNFVFDSVKIKAFII
jgi:hypothetical protein